MTKVEFLIHEVLDGVNGTLVTGIVNQGTVTLSTEFLAVRDRTGASHPVALKVMQITAYRRCLDELPNGMSGGLLVSGNGVDHLAQRHMLVD